MRTYSTPESAQNGEITKLAIVEAVLSVALYVGICTYFEAWRTLSLIVIGAPLMLFRTEGSATWALRHWARWARVIGNILKPHVIEPPTLWRGIAIMLLMILIVLPITPIIGIVLRVVGTVYCAVRHPLKTLREVPNSWVRQTLCTDFIHPPEIVPMETLKGREMELFCFDNIRKAISNMDSIPLRLTGLVMITPVLLIGYLPSATYRISFKATAIVYAPFIWAAHATLRTPLPFKVRLERITKGEFEKVRRWYSGLVLAAVSAKAAFAFGLVSTAPLEKLSLTGRATETFVAPDRWPMWQLMFTSDALLTFGLLWFADASLARLETPNPWPERLVVDTVSVVSFARVVLSLITIGHLFRLALHVAFPGVPLP